MKPHYTTVYKKRIQFLERKIRDYYMAIYRTKQCAGLDPGICAVTVFEGNEEFLIVRDAKSLKKLIDNLPLWDCGC